MASGESTEARSQPNPPADPHAGQPVLSAGVKPEEAAATIVMIHGRGGSAKDVLALHSEIGVPSIASIAPQAAGFSWYPSSFLAPTEENQPYLDSAISRIDSLVSDLRRRGIDPTRIGLVGFSQGACLALEYVARYPRRYGGVMALTGGLIGESVSPRSYKGSLAGTPIFLGSGDPDPHVPFERVSQSASILEGMGAEVDLRRYPGMPHIINDEEILACRRIVEAIASPSLRK